MGWKGKGRADKPKNIAERLNIKNVKVPLKGISYAFYSLSISE